MIKRMDGFSTQVIKKKNGWLSEWMNTHISEKEDKGHLNIFFSCESSWHTKMYL